MLDLIFRKSTGFLLLTALLFVLGLLILFRLPVMMYPKTQRPEVQINMNHQGISAVDFQKQYADYIEPRLLSLDDLDLLETTYSTDSSRFNLTFNWNIDSDEARSEVENLMISIDSTLPEVIRDSYSVRYKDSENAGYLVMGLTSESTPAESLYQLLKTNLEPQLSRISDVDEIGFYNTRRLVVDLKLEQMKMLSYGITINDVNSALQSGFLPQPLGSMDTDDGRLSVRLNKAGGQLGDLARLEVKKVGDSIISIDDIAVLDIRYTLPSRVFLVEGEPAVQLTATPVEGGNVTAMTREIRKIIQDSMENGQIPSDTELFLYLDPAKYIQNSINNVIHAALLGGVLAIFIVFIFLGELKNTLLIAVSLPISIIFSFILMKIFNLSINLISLGGLALAVGMIVDSTIVVMENIHRHRNKMISDDLTGDFQWKKTIFSAVGQVRAPVIASTVTSVLVFLPISFTAPLTNAILGDQARTVVFALIASLGVSLTIVPVIAYYSFRGAALKNRKSGKLQSSLEKFTKTLIKTYSRSLQSLLKRKIQVVIFLIFSFIILLVSVFLILPLIPKEIISTPASDRIVLFFRNSAVSDPEILMEEFIPEMNRQIEEALGDLLLQKYSNISGRFNQTFLDLRSSQDSDEAIRRLQKIFISEGDWYFNIMTWDPAALPLPHNYDFQLSLSGPDPSVKVELLNNLQLLLTEKELFRRVITRPSSTITGQLNLTTREGTIDEFAPWTEQSLSLLIRRILGGTSTIDLTDGNEDVEVTAEYPEDQIDSREELEDFLIPWRQHFIPLKHFFDFDRTNGVSQVSSENGEPVFRLYGYAGFRISDSERLRIQNEARDLIFEEVVFPSGYSYTFDNPRIEMDSSIRSLFTALLISIVLIYLLLVFLFNSFWIPLVILITIPFGFIGVIFSLWIFKSTLNLNSLLGTILLGGIVVNNAIILIDFYLKSSATGKNRKRALIEAASTRFLPIVITSFTTLFGMLPLAIGLGEGSNILQPLGIAVSGGLLVSTVFTIYAVPSLLFLTLNDRKDSHEQG